MSKSEVTMIDPMICWSFRGRRDKSPFHSVA